MTCPGQGGSRGGQKGNHSLRGAGGYQFVNVLHERYICKVCNHPCQDPCLTGCCGHNFCKSCLDDVKRTSFNCPVCQDKEFTVFPNKQADREFRSLHVMCTNKERGCEWQGELNDINNHLGNRDGCQFEIVTMTVEIWCNDGIRLLMLRTSVQIV